MAAAKADLTAAQAAVSAVNDVKSDLNTLVKDLVAGVEASTFQVRKASFADVDLGDITGSRPVTLTLQVAVSDSVYDHTLDFTLGADATTVSNAFIAIAENLAKEMLHASKAKHPVHGYYPKHADGSIVKDSVEVKVWTATNVQLINQHRYDQERTCIGVGNVGNKQGVEAAAVERKSTVVLSNCYNGDYPINGWDLLPDGRIRSHGSNYCITYDDVYIMLTCFNHENQSFPVIREGNDKDRFFVIAGGDGTYTPATFHDTPSNNCLRKGVDYSIHGGNNIVNHQCLNYSNDAWYVEPYPKTVAVPPAPNPASVTTPSPQQVLTSLSLETAPPAGSHQSGACCTESGS